ncbi:hypothetical protein Pmani_016365 [Petrolisthes manimaculis]|uniref:Uncharacterized protein n=1 Tax=Petrolisthes manimaculis TaxID=1843537 RepID=A0AAE1U6S1_9EUCA|nr:hypothetical protein Pmani_016365 [Petrolisthes manimaculis]
MLVWQLVRPPLHIPANTGSQITSSVPSNLVYPQTVISAAVTAPQLITVTALKLETPLHPIPPTRSGSPKTLTRNNPIQTKRNQEKEEARREKIKCAFKAQGRKGGEAITTKE